MNGIDRKEAVNAYKERTKSAGIFAIRCAATGECWVGRAPDVDTIRNRLWFTLRQGSSTHRAVQAAWRDHGEAAFHFEIVERLEEEDFAYARDRILKERLAHWAAEMRATAI
jgi:hypothetical protein